MAQVVRKSNKAAWANIEKLARELTGPVLQVGWFDTNKYEDGTPVAYVALIHEFGYLEGGIPPRPFMRPTIAREETKWRALVEQSAVKITAGNMTVDQLFDILGLSVSGEIARSISEVFAPPLKPATIKAKQRKMAKTGLTGALDKPLVESGIMLDTVTYVIENS